MKWILSIFVIFITQIHTDAQANFAEIVKECEGAYSDIGDIRQRNLRSLNCLVGKKIPNLSLPLMSGGRFEMSQYEDDIVLLNFWFSKCAPCIAEMPILNKLHKKFSSKGVRFVSLSIDSKAQLEGLMSDLPKINFPIAYGAKETINHELGILYGFPMTIILDKGGIIKYIQVGGAGQSALESLYGTLSTHIQLCL